MIEKINKLRFNNLTLNQQLHSSSNSKENKSQARDKDLFKQMFEEECMKLKNKNRRV